MNRHPVTTVVENGALQGKVNFRALQGILPTHFTKFPSTTFSDSNPSTLRFNHIAFDRFRDHGIPIFRLENVLSRHLSSKPQSFVPVIMAEVECTVIYAESSYTLSLRAPRSMTVDDVKKEAVKHMEKHMKEIVPGIKLDPTSTDFFPGKSSSEPPSSSLSLTRRSPDERQEKAGRIGHNPAHYRGVAKGRFRWQEPFAPRGTYQEKRTRGSGSKSPSDYLCSTSHWSRQELDAHGIDFNTFSHTKWTEYFHPFTREEKDQRSTLF
jgi:hypothetical protein